MNYKSNTLKDLEKRSAQIDQKRKKTPSINSQASTFFKSTNSIKNKNSKPILRYESFRETFYRLWQMIVYTKEELKPLVITDHNARVVKHILQWMTNFEFNNYYINENESQCDYEDCNCNKLNPNKGLYIWGETGRGKTKFVKSLVAFMNNANRDYDHIPKVHSYDYKSIFSNSKIIQGSEKHYSHPESVFIDDLGWMGENQITIYGNKENLVSDIIDFRYRKWDSTNLQYRYKPEKKYAKVIITTNISPTDFLDIYGERLHGRLNEMCNLIAWDGENLRIQK